VVGVHVGETWVELVTSLGSDAHANVYSASRAGPGTRMPSYMAPKSSALHSTSWNGDVYMFGKKCIASESISNVYRNADLTAKVQDTIHLIFTGEWLKVNGKLRAGSCHIEHDTACCNKKPDALHASLWSAGPASFTATNGLEAMQGRTCSAHGAKSPAEFLKQFRRDLVTTVPFHLPQNAELVVVFEQRLVVLLEALQPCLPHLWVIIRASSERLACDIVLALNFGRVECRVVNSPRRFVYPAIADAIDDDVGGRIQIHDQINGHDRIQLDCLTRGPGEAVQYERGRRPI
jgi:hypothetical protein